MNVTEKWVLSVTAEELLSQVRAGTTTNPAGCRSVDM